MLQVKSEKETASVFQKEANLSCLSLKLYNFHSCLTVLTGIGFEILASLTEDCCRLGCCVVSCPRTQYSSILTEFYTENF
jgi:hypothetical protein